MKINFFGILFLMSTSVIAMQQPVHVYDQEQTKMLQSLLNVFDYRGNPQPSPPCSKIEELVVMGADPNVKADCGACKDRSWLEFLNLTGKELNCITLIVAHGARVSEDLLMRASMKGEYALVMLLLDRGVKSANSHSPLFYATQYKHLGIAKLLLDRGAASDIDNTYNMIYSPLSWAQKHKQVTFLKLFDKYRITHK
jgi:hypothetical protein